MQGRRGSNDSNRRFTCDHPGCGKVRDTLTSHTRAKTDYYDIN